MVDTAIRNSKLDGYKTICIALKTVFSRKKEKKVRKVSKSQHNLLRNTFT